jgi:membrane-associated protein
MSLDAVLEFFRHLKPTLERWSGDMGPWFYVVLFAIVFAETGLVVLPFLPGDSLLFAVGAVVAGKGSPVSLPLVVVLMTAAAILGDAVNYQVGLRLGPAVFKSETSRWLNKKHLLRAQEFYEKHGAKTIVIARFVPIVRTFAPFVAGVGRMSYWRFALYNVVGGALWVVSMTLAGYWFGNIEWVEKHFEAVVVGIVVVSVVPIFVEYVKARRASARA